MKVVRAARRNCRAGQERFKVMRDIITDWTPAETTFGATGSDSQRHDSVATPIEISDAYGDYKSGKGYGKSMRFGKDYGGFGKDYGKDKDGQG